MPINFPSSPTPGQKYPYQGRVWEWSGVAWRVLSGPTIEIRERRHEYVAPYSYCGTAVYGSSENSNVWEITRIEILANGSTINTKATNVKWSERFIVGYS